MTRRFPRIRRALVIGALLVFGAWSLGLESLGLQQLLECSALGGRVVAFDAPEQADQFVDAFADGFQRLLLLRPALSLRRDTAELREAVQAAGAFQLVRLPRKLLDVFLGDRRQHRLHAGVQLADE